MVSNTIASIIQDTKRDKVTIVLNEPYRMGAIKLSVDDEMLLLSIFSELIKSKIGAMTNDK